MLQSHTRSQAQGANKLAAGRRSVRCVPCLTQGSRTGCHTSQHTQTHLDAPTNRWLQDAAAAGAKVLFLPENFSFLGRAFTESLAVAEPLSGPLMAQYCQLARDTGLWLSLGGFQEVGPDPEHLYNCHVVVNAEGEQVAAYRKIHLFNVDVPNGPVLMESRFTAPGQQLAACDSPAGRLGLSVCYDLRCEQRGLKQCRCGEHASS